MCISVPSLSPAIIISVSVFDPIPSPLRPVASLTPSRKNANNKQLCLRLAGNFSDLRRKITKKEEKKAGERPILQYDSFTTVTAVLCAAWS